MMNAMYSAISGLEVNQTMLNVAANNLANVSTAGYKSASIDFSSSLSQLMHGASGSDTTTGGTNPLQIGLGVQVAATTNEMTEGAFQTTTDPLDVAIEGSGFLRVGTGTPPTKAPYTEALPKNLDYTRAGTLMTDANGFLTTQGGLYVVGFNAEATKTESGTTYAPGTKETYIHVPPDAADVTIAQNGAVTYTDQNPKSETYGQVVTAGFLSLASFPNETGLERLGSSLWGATVNSGTPTVSVPGENGLGTTIGGELEMSNVNLASEMTAMITAERGYQANSRLITTANEMLSSAVSMVQ